MTEVLLTDGSSWWRHGVVYQVYPRSFLDADGDGIGDLPGIAAKLDYLAWLGADAVWISPIFPSPMADFGYDVADYLNVDPLFGTLADFDRLVAEAHRRGLRIILDFVPNHTSDRHPWFIEARSSRDSPKRDWYIWHDAAPDGAPPNNWLSEFGGSAWAWDAPTGQFYYHAYLKEQPDLNWRHPDVRAAMLDVLRFWLDRGVDGFRVDAIHHLIKDDRFRDNPPNPDWRPAMPPSRRLLRLYTTDRPELHDAVAEMRSVLDRYGGRVLIGEAYLPIDRLMAYYGIDLGGFHLPFNFHLLDTPWTAGALADLVASYETALPPGAWPNWVLGNHDRSRVATRVGAAQARVAAMLLLTLRGTPTIYYGDEIGMGDVAIPPDRVQDPWEKNEPGHGFGRDPVRTPMLWDRSANAGFSTSRPWLPLAEDYATANVEVEASDPASILTLYRSLITLRRSEPALSAGSYAQIGIGDGTLVYTRQHGDRALLVALNLTAEARVTEIPGTGRVLLSTRFDRGGDPVLHRMALQPDEGVVVGLDRA